VDHGGLAGRADQGREGGEAADDGTGDGVDRDRGEPIADCDAAALHPSVVGVE
jgi:hypothetical protein